MSQPNRDLPRPSNTSGPQSAREDRDENEQEAPGNLPGKEGEHLFPDGASSPWEQPPPEDRAADDPQGTSGSLVGYDPEILIALER